MYNTVTSCKCVIDIVLWLARTWFLKIDPVRIISMRVCVPAPEAINNNWHDKDYVRLVKQVL